MRKYIKSMREQFDNNSVIFKEAKRMFHYVPTPAENRHFGLNKLKNKKEANTFKDDYSSVKDLKNENNQINESSWIAKLVNGIQEHSLQEMHIPACKQFNGKQLSASEVNEKEPHKEKIKSVRTQNIVIITNDERQPLQNVQNRLQSHGEVQTKKNSYNFKKRSRAGTEKLTHTKQRNDSFCLSTDQIVKSSNKTKSIDQCRQLSTNKSQSLLKSDYKMKEKIGNKKKSLQNIKVQKLVNEEEKGKKCATEQKNIIPKIIEKTPTEKKSKIRISEAEGCKMSESLASMEQINYMTSDKEELTTQQNKQKNNFLSQNCCVPLFQEPEHGNIEINANKTIRYRQGCGSIRKNSKKGIQIKQKDSCSLKQQSTEVIFSPRFSSNSRNYEQIAIKPGQDNDIISAREQKRLVQKYLATNYNRQNNKKCSLDAIRTRNESQRLGKRDFTKKYHYDIQEAKNNEQTLNKQAQRSQKIQIITANQYRSNAARETKSHQRRNEGISNIQIKNNPNSHAYLHENQREYRKIFNNNIQPVQNLVAPVQNYRQIQHILSSPAKIKDKQSSKPLESKHKYHKILNKNAYLQSQSDSTMMESIQNSSQKYQSRAMQPNIKEGVPSKHSYLALSSTSQKDFNSKEYCSGQKAIAPLNVQGSDIVIDRLNSKLSLYISQHQLKEGDTDRPKQWNEEQATHRVMHLNFKQLKKHGEILKR